MAFPTSRVVKAVDSRPRHLPDIALKSLQVQEPARLPEPQQLTSPVLISAEEVELPAVLESAGSAARFAWEEFIYAQVRNPHTRRAYERAVRKFLEHCERLGRELPQISPRDVAEE